MGVREGFLFSKSQRITPEEILESLRKHYNFDKSYSTIWSVCKARTLQDFNYLNKSFNKDTIGLIIQFDTLEEQIQELINALPKEIAEDLEFNNISFMLEYEEYFKDQNFNDYNFKKNKINKNEREEKKMKIKVEVREAVSEKDAKLRGFADLNIGDVVIKDVAIKEFESKENENATYYGFQMPTSRFYEKEKEDGTKEKVYIPAVELKCTKEEDTKKLVKEVRKLITQAMDYSEKNEYGKKVCFNDDFALDYNKDKITAFVNPVNNENRPNLKGFATVYLGNVVKINDIAMTEGTKENGEKFTGINMPSKVREIDGEKKFEEKVFPVGEGMRKAVVQAIEESYLETLEKQSKEEEQKQEEDEEEECL